MNAHKHIQTPRTGGHPNTQGPAASPHSDTASAQALGTLPDISNAFLWFSLSSSFVIVIPVVGSFP